MRIAIIGSNGQLGVDLCGSLAAAGHTVLPLTRADLDVTNPVQVDSILSDRSPEIVVSTAAFHQVERCESDPMTSLAVNALGARNVALACRKLNAVLVYLSTDYVFGGSKRQPYLETDLPAPLNIYGASKLAGETMVALTWPKHFVLRTSGLYGRAGSSGKGGNFVETMLRKAAAGDSIKVVDDQILTPTYTADLAEAVAKLLATEQYGLYHLSAAGQCSWYEFASRIFALTGVKADLSPVLTTEFPSPVVRPSFSVLDKSKVNALGIRMPEWTDGLARYLQLRHPPAGTVG